MDIILSLKRSNNGAFWEAEDAVKLLFDGPPRELRIENQQVTPPQKYQLQNKEDAVTPPKLNEPHLKRDHFNHSAALLQKSLLDPRPRIPIFT